MKVRLAVSGAALAAVVLAGCGQYVGPARTYGTYEHKAAATAEAALSAVQTVELMAQTAAAGRSFGPFTGIAVSDQEDALSAAQGTFSSIQPPDERSDALREELGALLDRSASDVSAVRIAARRAPPRGWLT